MATAWQAAKRWRIVPEPWRGGAGPAERAAYGEALRRMRRSYVERALEMRRPPVAGAAPSPLPGAPRYPVNLEDLEEYTVENDRWIDEVYLPAEAERVIWEAAREVEEEWTRRVRAAADLREVRWLALKPRLLRWALIGGLALLGGGIAIGLSTILG